MPPPGLRERKKLETHRTIALAALRLVDEHGLDRVTVDDIAAAAGVSTRTFFNYFASKEDAVLIAYADHAERAARTIDRFAAQPAGLGTFAALVATMREEMAEIEQNEAEWLARLRIVQDDPALMSRATALSSPSREPMVQAIARRSGTDPEQDLYPSLVLAVLGGVLNTALGRWSALDGARPLHALFDEAVAIAAAGLPDPS
ncbi:TetR/AcrR family transcriptional regulator [Amycolatopsis benzoatilytica]|uniref:TetR/AcrR family transcriptional regulator n=1 Tax=Amycolatopsis benzoatilytica TaxID=346045 RepID=UPI00036E1DB4|nr:TetR/AcrR family transcriptional regulator [Amycolatopsis benzoatilytica]